jgi:two-component sensor histidine kinase
MKQSFPSSVDPCRPHRQRACHQRVQARFRAERKDAISVALRRGKNYLLSVTDNGKGCSKSATSGLGSQLVELLVRQLEGNLERTEAMPGCRVQIEFPERA